MVGAIALFTLVVTRVTPLDGALAEGATFGVWLLLFALLVPVLALSGFLLGRIVREVNRVSAAVARLEDSDFSARVPEPRMVERGRCAPSRGRSTRWRGASKRTRMCGGRCWPT